MSNQTSSPPPLAVDRQEAARLLSCSIRTIDRMIQRGDLTTVPVGDRLVRVTMESLRKFGEGVER